MDVVVSPWGGVIHFVAGLTQGLSQDPHKSRISLGVCAVSSRAQRFCGPRNKILWVITARTQKRLCVSWVPVTTELHILTVSPLTGWVEQYILMR